MVCLSAYEKLWNNKDPIKHVNETNWPGEVKTFSN